MLTSPLKFTDLANEEVYMNTWILGSILLFSLRATAGCLSEDIIPDSYLVRFKDSQSLEMQSYGPSLQEKIRSLGPQKFHMIHDQAKTRAKSFSTFSQELVPPSLAVVKMNASQIADLAKDERVLSITNDCVYHLTKTPNDPKYSQLWAHQVIHSEEAWNLSTGSSDIIVAVSDTGVDYTHEDLAANMWTNPNEIPGNGIDDDHNGCIDDVHGCDFANHDGDPKPGTATGSDHGTHVAGTIAAVGNNGVGVVGISWSNQIMAVKGFADNQEGASMSDLINTVYYAADNGARVINCSWGGSGSPSQAEKDAFLYAISKGVVPVIAAGNSTQDAANFSPAAIPQVLTVGASNSKDQLATFSNFGSVVDVIAPGGDFAQSGMGINEQIFSTLPMKSGKYGGMQGTSMAAPHVAGLAGLVFSVNPNLIPEEVMSLIINSGDKVDVIAANSAHSRFTYPRINSFKAVQAALASLPSSPDDGCIPNTPCASSGGSAATELAKLGSGCSLLDDHQKKASAGNEIPFLLLFLLPSLLLLRRRK